MFVLNEESPPFYSVHLPLLIASLVERVYSPFIGSSEVVAVRAVSQTSYELIWQSVNLQS